MNLEDEEENKMMKGIFKTERRFDGRNGPEKGWHESETSIC